MTRVRELALIGAGTIGRRHIAAVSACGDARLVAVADPDPAVAALAAGHGAAYHADYTAMLAERRPHGVIVATPTEHHLQPALAALEHGAGVLVEKPVTATAADAERLSAAADAAGRPLLVGHHRRYYPLLERVRELIRGGALGRLLAVQTQWTLLKPDDYYRADWRRRREAGPVLINLVHEIDSLRYLCGEIRAVSASLSHHARGFHKEDSAAVIFELCNGALVSTLISDATPSPWSWEFASGENPDFPPAYQNVWRFCGSEAALEFPNLKLWRQHPDRRGWHHPIAAESLRVVYGDAFAAQCRHFCAVLRGEQTPRIDGRDAARTLAATLAVFTAAERGGRVELDAG